MSAPLLAVDGLVKEYRMGVFKPKTTFRIEADFTIEKPTVIGVMGPNGSGKTTLFELMTGSNAPTAGRVMCAGQNIHRVKTGERDRLAIHYHQSYQVRHFDRSRPDFMLEKAKSDYPLIHLFDEPQFNTQDGYIGFMLNFFRKLRAEERLVFICLHPTETYHIELLNDVCEQFIFVHHGTLTHADSLPTLAADPRFQDYLGNLVTAVA
ncbi:ATP-binding cassette domain-containing protein [Acuticoccus sp. M5D2P5]|uniref:ATP-binding cassette domain-containing protein n=1 Tax=Acuticoccus kalidii TaxID=2910977 RepID=UPI001F2EDF04|nr:ATP-binding cassette domain-containing protein [Acuticoccus kalidii]MCF3935186.1 ATP-binding cassette domain-containing protein [Acuticoccus kalidii]